jgi:hypothetical protein
MNDFEKQIERNTSDRIREFLSKPEYSDIKDLYRNNFDTIYSFIQRTKHLGYRIAIEDIASLNKNLSAKIIGNMLFLQDINRAIAEHKLRLEDF